MLACRYAYGKLNVHGRAAVLYGQALESFGGELEKVDASIAQHPRGQVPEGAGARGDPARTRTGSSACARCPMRRRRYYLTELMASHDFQTALQNYLDLEDLRRKLVTWQTQLRCLRRHDSPAPRRTTSRCCRTIDAQFRELDSQMRLRLEQREHLASACRTCSRRRGRSYLATADERIASRAHSHAIEKQLRHADDPDARHCRSACARLKGALTWRCETEYPRAADAGAHAPARAECTTSTLSRRGTTPSSGRDRRRRTAMSATTLPISGLRDRVGEALAAA